jgi:hypothetical protein
LASLKSSFDTKKELLNDLQKELQEIGVRADSGARSARVFVATSCMPSCPATVPAAINWKKR